MLGNIPSAILPVLAACCCLASGPSRPGDNMAWRHAYSAPRFYWGMGKDVVRLSAAPFPVCLGFRHECRHGGPLLLFSPPQPSGRQCNRCFQIWGTGGFGENRTPPPTAAGCRREWNNSPSPFILPQQEQEQLQQRAS
ncbi:hypothetical protein B0H63DRAFT_458772 [Podospora didyma]|uniref:Secreted protein n=1 Tax=Podospora didyma TaxID=330526 RepID=A0AAE0U7C5_9PEZI|nr:hypothetical protein B0H63DRAFT_458772 [Podospora didyma]